MKEAALKLKGEEPKNPEWQRELLADVRETVRRAESDPTGTGFNLEFSGAFGGGRFSIHPNQKHGGAVVAAELNAALKADPDKPWKSWGRSLDGLTVSAQSRALASFGVKTVNVKVGEAVPKAYPLDGKHGLKVAFEAFLEPLGADENAEEGV